MIVVYADETGTQGLKKGGKEPAPGVYGLLDTPGNWEKFRGVWSDALKKYTADYFHFRQLNPSERKKPGNPYFQWDEQKVDDFIHDMAVAASTGPIPFGGDASIKLLYGGRTDKEAHLGTYKAAIEMFFRDFSDTMNTHFPGESAKVAFFFAENENKEWSETLNAVAKKERKRDRRIGQCSFTDPKSYLGMPCQAADLFAFVNRQQRETTYETQAAQKTRLLDFIISRHAFPKDNPRSMYAKYSDAEWAALISILRADKKLKHTRNVAQGLGKQQYYPFKDNELLKLHMAQWVAKEPQLFTRVETQMKRSGPLNRQGRVRGSTS